MPRGSRDARSLGGAELVLEPLDRGDRAGVHSPPRREVKRDEVAEQHGPQEALGAALALRLEVDDGRRMLGDRLRGQLETPANAGVLVAIGEKDRRHSPAGATVSLWSASGSECENAGSFAFSFT